MKSYLIILAVVLCSTCWLYDDPDAPPTACPEGISGTPEGTAGVDKEEGTYGDFYITDEPRQSGFVTKIDEKTPANNMDFPLGEFR